MPTAKGPNDAAAPSRFVRHVLITIAILSAVYLAWLVRDVTMIIFGGVLLAVLVTSAAHPLKKYLHLPDKAAVGAAIVLLILLIVGAGWWIGDSILIQFSELQERLPQAFEAFRQWLRTVPFGSTLVEQWSQTKDTRVPWAQVAGYTGTTLGALANTVLIVAIGLYLAASPGLYRKGLIALTPPAYRAQMGEGLHDAAEGLRSWLLGQLFLMVTVGVITAVGLYFLDIPLAVPLGIIAGLLEFIPFIGPVVFGVVAILLAFTEGATAALYVALFTLAVQQLEGYVLTPLIQKRTVALPPALGLVSVIIFGTLFALPGILFATPLMVVVMILVQKWYVEQALEGTDPTGGNGAT